ncbi:MAG: universal stress protein [Acidimicrobiales bacterium]
MNDPASRAPDPSYRAILVPLDGSHLAAGALPTAHALGARFGATVHTVTVAVSDFELRRVRTEAARALGTDPDDGRIHVEVGTDVARAIHRRAAALGASLICLSSHARGRVDGTLIGSTARDIIEHGRAPVVVAGPFVAHPDPQDETATPPLEVDHLVACVDGTPASELGVPTAAAWARALGMKLTLVTVAEPCPPPVRIGAPWRRHHGPDEDADDYMRSLAQRLVFEAPGLDACVVYDPISPGSGIKDYLAANPTGLLAVTSRLRGRPTNMMFGSSAADIVHASSAPALVIPAA